MKNFFLILFIILLVGSGYFLYNLNNTNIQLQTQISSLKGELSGLTLQIVELQSFQTTTGATEKVLLELANTNTGSMSLEEENQTLKELAQKYKDALILEKLKNKSTTDTTNITNKTTTTNTNTITPIVSTNNKVQYKGYGANCGRSDSEGKPNSNYFKAAKSVNAKLQEVWNNGQNLVSQYINEANNNLSNTSLSNSDKCAYSWLIDELQNQKGYLKSHKTQNGIVTIGIDFVTYKESLQDIDFGPPNWFFQTKNTSTKVREYNLASSPQLQTLYVDNRGFTTNDEQKSYINNFSNRLNEFCNGQKIYTTSEGTNMNRNENNGYCVKHRISPNSNYGEMIISFGFSLKGEIQKIDLNRRYLSTAG